MYRRPSKRLQFIQRMAIYVTMVISVIAIVSIVLLVVLGFRINSENGLEQGALLQFNSRPGGAVVMVDDTTIGGRTANKSTVIAGKHTVTMLRDGYQPWVKDVDLAAGTLTWLDYGILIPTQLPVTTIATYTGLADVEMSPNRESVVLLPDASKPELQVYDLRSQTPTGQTMALSQDLYSESTTEGATHVFTLNETTGDGRYVVVKHTYTTDAGSADEWLVLDTDGIANSKNISRLLEINLSEVHFSGNGGTVLYGLSDGVVRKLDLSAQTISRPLVANVSRFTMVENNVVAYVGLDAADNQKQYTGFYQDGDDQAAVLQTNAAGTTSFIASSRYFNTTYIALVDGKEVALLKGDLPHTASDVSKLQLITRFETQGEVLALSFSPDGQYIFAQTNKGYVSYDIEHTRYYPVVTAAEDGNELMSWIDQATLVSPVGGQLTSREFDGANRHALMSVDPAYPATLSPNGRYLYGIGRTADSAGVQLQRITLILE